MGVILGLDGDYIEKDLLKIDPKIEFKAVDLTTKITLDRKFDMAMSLEVGEHLAEEHSEQFIDNIVDASDVVLFSAALPGQYGIHHVNECYISYWINKFNLRGYQCYDVVRPIIWWDQDVDLDYRQNTVIFLKKGSKFEPLLGSLNTKIVDIAHPEFLEARTKAWRYWMDKVEMLQKRWPLLSKFLKKIWSRYKNL